MESTRQAAGSDQPTLESIPGEAALRVERQQVFRHEGEFWTVIYDGVVCHFRDTRGFGFVAQLLQRPNERVAAIELITASAPERRGGGSDGAGLDDAHASDGQNERARVNVTRAIKAALRRIAERDAALAAHLRATIKTGSACSYLPDPRLPIEWSCVTIPPEASRPE